MIFSDNELPTLEWTIVIKFVTSFTFPDVMPVQTKWLALGVSQGPVVREAPPPIGGTVRAGVPPGAPVGFTIVNFTCLARCTTQIPGRISEISFFSRPCCNSPTNVTQHSWYHGTLWNELFTSILGMVLKWFYDFWFSRYALKPQWPIFDFHSHLTWRIHVYRVAYPPQNMDWVDFFNSFCCTLLVLLWHNWLSKTVEHP